MRKSLITLIVTIALMAMVDGSCKPNSKFHWPMWGGSIKNTHYQKHEEFINVDNVQNLNLTWSFPIDGDVSAIPTFKNDLVYFPDWQGNVYCFDISNNSPSLIWKINLANFTGNWGYSTLFGYNGTVSRNSPLLIGNKVIVADRNSGLLFALKAKTGKLIWQTLVDPHPAAAGTSSPVELDGIIYHGMSSREENFAADPNYPCCTHRGSMNAIFADNGTVKWTFYTIPENNNLPNGFSGGSVWGHNPTIDPQLGLIYFGTGNNYNVPQYVKDCLVNHTTEFCSPPENHVDSILAVHISNGTLAWADNFAGSKGIDAWTVACILSPFHPNCPVPTGPDYGFGNQPMIFDIFDGLTETKVIGSGSKNGLFITLNRQTGDIVWSTYVGPGGTLGGIQWGAAVDNKRIYVGLVNNKGHPYTLPDGTNHTAGSWAALNKNTGQIIWQTKVPNNGYAMGPLTVTGSGIVFAGSTNTIGSQFFALDARNGNILWDYSVGGSVNVAPLIVDGRLFWPCGYESLGIFTRCRTFYQFELTNCESLDD